MDLDWTLLQNYAVRVGSEINWIRKCLFLVDVLDVFVCN